MNYENNLPYIECSRVISNISLVLSKNGETQFIPFVHLYDSFSTNTGREFFRDELLKNIEDFDFALGTPTGKHILSVLQLNQLYLELKNIYKNEKNEIQRKLRRLINTIDADPPLTQKLVRQLLLMKTDIDDDCKELFISFNQQVKIFNECITAKGEITKELFQAPLKYLEDYALGKIYLSLGAYFESIVLCIIDNKHLIERIFYLKESILSGDSENIYNEFLILIQEYKLNIDTLKQVHSDAIENKIYIKRFLVQLVKTGENVTEIKKLGPKLHKFSSEHKVKLSSVLDEEIQKLSHDVSAISKQSIVLARLELRMNDDAYPLSVAYREFVKNLVETSSENQTPAPSASTAGEFSSQK